MAVLQAQWETLFGTTYTGTPKLPYFQRGERVWKKADFDGGLATWSNSNQYEIVDLQFITFDDSGTERFSDKNGVEVTNAGTQPGDETSGWFYRVKRAGTEVYEEGVHESLLLNEADIETYIGTQVSTFINET